ncbi:MAG TPA: hypothetical protein VHL09_02580 [Dehalococcoidia bacterium]|nr:hypothetical protein [Dehalococcoidia bacterium]
MRSLIRGLLACVLIATPLLPASVAAAAETETATEPPIIWPALPCATGEMVASVIGSDIWVSGWIQPCAGTEDSSATFAIGYYRVLSAAWVVPLSYQGATTPTTFSGHLTPEAVTGLRAICLTFNPTGRLACYAVERSPDGLTVTPIGVNDRLVRLPVTVTSRNPDTGTTCGNCV